jgi:hypothetical protein
MEIMAAAAVFRICDFWSSFLIVVGKEKTTLAANLILGAAALVAWYALQNGSVLSIASIALVLAFMTTISSFVLSVYFARKAVSEIKQS